MTRASLLLIIAACGPTRPDDGATDGDTGGAATSTATATATATSTATATATATATSTTTGATDDSAASVDPTVGKLDLQPAGDEPPPSPPACDPPPVVPPDAHCEVLQHSRAWDFMYACLDDVAPDACPDAAASAVLDLLHGCDACTFVGEDAICGPDPGRADMCCYWGFGAVQACPFP